ncbi:MAG: TrkH family potassium uptake protein [Desulfurococcales archaeon]|nr:TrkH family potassium uptake protein [Desulfurococcales archaeon]MCE4605118.1 TrkH family potassium uptake protein [Desulfurococcales archaeon]
MKPGRLLWPLGASLVAAGLPILSSGVISATLYGEAWPGWSLTLLGTTYLLAGLLLYKKYYSRLHLWEAVTATTLIWIITPILGAAPFYMLLHIPLLDSLFESVSAWTTTGLTIFTGEPSSSGGVYVPSVEELPEAFKWLRTLTQWEGGLGIVVFTIAVLAPPGISVAVLYLAEGRFERLEASLKRSAMIMGEIYVLITLAGIALFTAAGMPLEDAVHHSMTGVATAGFSTHSDSLGFYHTTPVLMAGMMVVMLGAISFSDHYNLLRLKLSSLRESVELKAQMLLLVASVLAGLALWERDPRLNVSMQPIDVVFNIVSTSATAGFQSSSLSESGPGYKLLLAVLALIGGSAFSTAGGIKVLRILVAMKSIMIEASKTMYPPGYMPNKRLGKYIVGEDLALRTLAVIAAILATYTILVITLLIAVPRIRLEDAMLEVASAMGNVGISSGITSAAASPQVKAILIVAMSLGRLEVIAYLIAIKSLAKL